MRKKSLDVRIEMAQKELEKPNVEKREVVKKIYDCLKENNIDGEVILVEPNLHKINYRKIMEIYNTNDEGHIIWVEFVESGHIAVVGAGKDIGFPESGTTGTWSILSQLPNVRWDRGEVIIIPIRGLDKKSVGLKNVDNILKCRNGVEHCIGEYLIDNNVPILNCEQHKNYSENYWNKCKNNNYML